MVESPQRPVNIFFSYAHEDEELVRDVRGQLNLFDRQKIISRWHDREIPPGAEWKGHIDSHLATSDIALLFISPDFFESDYCYDVEMAEALNRHTSGTARVIPVILRPCSWQSAPFASLQALPTDGIPVTRWANRDEACLNIAEGIMGVVYDLSSKARIAEPVQQDRPSAAAARNVLLPNTSTPELQHVRCDSGLCGSEDVQLSDSVEIVSLKADADGWTGHGSVRLDYSVDGRCLTCGRTFEIVKRAIPLQFPDLACNGCGENAFLKYSVKELKKVANGYEFGVEIRCAECSGGRTITRVLTSLIRTAAIELGLTGIIVKQRAA